MPSTEVSIPLPPECNPQQPENCNNNGEVSIDFTNGAIEQTGNTNPDCAFFVPPLAVAGAVKAFLWLHQRKVRLRLNSHTIDYSQE